MIGSRELGLMKPTSVLINASRGEVINEQALIEALRDHKIAGACLDVYTREPPSGPLLELPNVLLTPHIGASTVEAQRSAAVMVAEKLKEFFSFKA
jgi:D-3-phosphoglycerate dehydrogenase